MPKHYIYPKPGPDGVEAAARVELHWQRDGGVQLAATKWMEGDGTTPDGDVEFLLPNEAGEIFRAWDGEFVELGRDRINHLIKQLRIARDQAFGKNE